MTTTLCLIVVSATPVGAEPPTVRAEVAPTSACVVAFQSSWNRLDFAVGVDRVRGSGVTLTRHGDVISGFLYGGATRVHRKGNRLTGVVAGADTTIHLERDDGAVTLRGTLPGLGRATIHSSGARFAVYSDRVALNLEREQESLMRGDVKVGDRFGEVSVRLTDCSNSLLSSRPDVILALALAPLAR